MTRALLHVSTSDTPYILQMNFSVAVAVFSVRRILAKANLINVKFVILLEYRLGCFLAMTTGLRHTITSSYGMERK